ncbi:MAG: glycerate kinase [Rhodospirillales bacterium]
MNTPAAILASPKTFLKDLMSMSLADVRPENCVPPALPPRPAGRTVVIGAGKASAAMAQAFERAWDGPLEGLVITRYGFARPCEKIEIVEASHPVPDAAGRDATSRIMQLAQTLGPDDLLVALISGGGSSLMIAPVDGVSLEDKQEVNRLLLKSGADITEMNCVRKHLSGVKGGRLAALAAPAALHCLMISDVPGDDPAVIASGPTVPDPTTLADARDILRRYEITPPASVTRALDDPANETPKPGDPAFESTVNQLVARPLQMLHTAEAEARRQGLNVINLGDRIEGEAREVAKALAGIARSIQESATPCATPALLLSGGELTVTVRGDGAGGPNQEFSLALAMALEGRAGIYAISCDTDGVDGSNDVAGAVIGPDTLTRGVKAGLVADDRLKANDAGGYFAAINDLVVTGPTYTNVNDFRAILILGEGE